MINIPEKQIVSVTDFLRNFKAINKNLEKEKINFIFKNNKPSKVIMTYDKYKEIMEILEYVEHKAIHEEIKNFEENDTGKRYSSEEVFDILDKV